MLGKVFQQQPFQSGLCNSPFVADAHSDLVGTNHSPSALGYLLEASHWASTYLKLDSQWTKVNPVDIYILVLFSHAMHMLFKVKIVKYQLSSFVSRQDDSLLRLDGWMVVTHSNMWSSS